MSQSNPRHRRSLSRCNRLNIHFSRTDFYNRSMAQQYAVVCYLSGELAEFAATLRSRLNPKLAHLRPHITLLSPRLLEVAAGQCAEPPETEAISAIEDLARQLAPVRISLGAVKTFLPNHPTVYIEVEDGARHLRYAHGLLKRHPFSAADQWPYVPHLTLATLNTVAEVEAADQVAAAEWATYPGERGTMLSEVSLVREDQPERWTDLATVSLCR
jgi:2'-5' RNA ligase